MTAATCASLSRHPAYRPAEPQPSRRLRDAEAPARTFLSSRRFRRFRKTLPASSRAVRRYPIHSLVHPPSPRTVTWTKASSARSVKNRTSSSSRLVSFARTPRPRFSLPRSRSARVSRTSRTSVPIRRAAFFFVDFRSSRTWACPPAATRARLGWRPGTTPGSAPRTDRSARRRAPARRRREAPARKSRRGPASAARLEQSIDGTTAAVSRSRCSREAPRESRAGTWRTGSSWRIWRAGAVRRPSMPSSRTSRSTASNTFEGERRGDHLDARLLERQERHRGEGARRRGGGGQRASRWSWHDRRDLRVVALQKRLLQKLEAAVNKRAACSKNPSMVFARGSARQHAERPPPGRARARVIYGPARETRGAMRHARLDHVQRHGARVGDARAHAPSAAAYWASKPAVMSDAEHPTRRPRRP